MHIPWEEKHVDIEVNRETAALDAFDAFRKIDLRDFSSTFRFKFKNEEALDAGGVAREWFSCVAGQIFDAKYMLFNLSKISKAYIINPSSTKKDSYKVGYLIFHGSTTKYYMLMHE